MDRSIILTTNHRHQHCKTTVTSHLHTGNLNSFFMILLPVHRNVCIFLILKKSFLINKPVWVLCWQAEEKKTSNSWHAETFHLCFTPVIRLGLIIYLWICHSHVLFLTPAALITNKWVQKGGRIQTLCRLPDGGMTRVHLACAAVRSRGIWIICHGRSPSLLLPS